MAAVLACGEGAVLSHGSAASLWELRDYSGAQVDVTSPSKSRSSASIRRHVASLASDEVTVQSGIPTTTVPRTIFDLAAGGDPHLVETLLRESEYRHLYDSLSLPDLLARYPGHRGATAIRTALDHLREAPGRTRRELERRFLALLDAHDLPRPHLNAWIEASGKRYEADCHWPTPNLVVELDGWQSHGTRQAFRTDRARDRAFATAGITHVRVTWSQLEDEPHEVAADLHLLLAAVRPQAPLKS